MNRRGLLAAGAAGTALAAPNLAAAQPQVMWRCAGSFPKSTDVLWGVQEMIARRVGELTGGAFQIRPFAAGELVPALQVMDAVTAGTIECGYTSAYYYIGKDPTLGFGTVMPFGMNTRQHLA
jgi:TRAP-type mannitol/chloroaromatic compound transport system substrate-binding protein